MIESSWKIVLTSCDIFSVLGIYLNVIQAKQMIRLLLFNNFHPVILYRRVQKKNKATNYCIRSLVMVREGRLNRFRRRNGEIILEKIRHFGGTLSRKQRIDQISTRCKIIFNSM